MMQNMDSEEQQALKSITKYAQITVDLSHEEQLCFYAQIENTGVPGFPDMVVNYSVEGFCFFLTLLSCPFYSLPLYRGERQK